METKQNLYKKKDDISVTTCGECQLAILNAQKCTIETSGAEGVENRYEAVALVFTEDDLEPGPPVVFYLETVDQADLLLRSLQKLRAQIWGFNLDFNNKN